MTSSFQQNKKSHMQMLRELYHSHRFKYIQLGDDNSLKFPVKLFAKTKGDKMNEPNFYEAKGDTFEQAIEELYKLVFGSEQDGKPSNPVL